MPRRLAHFSDPRLDAQIGELIKKHRELQKDIEQLERRLQKPIGLPDAMPPTEHEHGVADITDFPEAMPPTAHKASHAGGSDAITPADIGAETPSGAQAKVDDHAAELVTQAGGVHGLEVETGTFTPILTAATTAPTVSYTIQEGHYVKEGKLVKCNFFLRCTVSGGSGRIEIRNLPFTPTNYREIGMIGEASLGTAKLPYSRLRNSSALTKLRILKVAKDWAEISEINSGALVDIIATMVYQIE